MIPLKNFEPPINLLISDDNISIMRSDDDHVCWFYTLIILMIRLLKIYSSRQIYKSFYAGYFLNFYSMNPTHMHTLFSSLNLKFFLFCLRAAKFESIFNVYVYVCLAIQLINIIFSGCFCLYLCEAKQKQKKYEIRSAALKLNSGSFTRKHTHTHTHGEQKNT